MPADDIPTIVHPDGGVVVWTRDGWRWRRDDGTGEAVWLCYTMAYCETEAERNAVCGRHADGIVLAAERGAWDTHRALVEQMADACTLLTAADIAVELGVLPKTIADYISDGDLPPAARRPGRKHGRTHQFSRRQVDDWVASRPGRAWRAHRT